MVASAGYENDAFIQIEPPNGATKNYGSTIPSKEDEIRSSLVGMNDCSQLYCDGDGEGEGDSSGKIPTYYDVLAENTEFRYYTSSYLVTKMGEWFSYVASLTFIAQSRPSSYLSISILLIVRLTPNVLLSIFGGTLADSHDRRVSMISLDVLSASTAILYLLSLQYNSIMWLYASVFLQQCLAGLYEPVRMAILPSLVKDEESMKKATTISSLIWSVMAAFGAGGGGLFAARYGLKACYVVDGLTYLLSAFLMYNVSGEYNPTLKEEPSTMTRSLSIAETVSTLWTRSKTMTAQGIQYIRSNFFGSLVLVKASGSLVYGASAVLNVALSEDSAQLGYLFSCVGIGCIVGPLLVDPWTDIKRPRTLQISCVHAFGIMGLGLAAMGWFSPFWCVCLFTLVRAAGASIMWINSSVLLQKFSKDEMLGRVSSVDYSFATLMEAVSALFTGLLMDRFGLSPHAICFVFAGFAVFFWILWFVYDMSGCGAASEHAIEGNRFSKQASDEAKERYCAAA